MKQNLKEKLEKRLLPGKFRLMNEKVYKTGTKLSKNDITTYHDGFRIQCSKWEEQPLEIIKKLLKNDKLIVDVGCGEAELEKEFNFVVSVDLNPFKRGVVCADMEKLPFSSKCADTVVLCLSLMCKKVENAVSEANRILNLNGNLIIAEVVSRVESVDEFVKSIEKFGFEKKSLLKNDYFFVCEFVKKSSKFKKIKIVLKPCIYKRR